MAKTATLNIRTDPIIKAQAEKIYQAFGITLTDAVNIFLRKSIMEGGLPFDMKQPRYNTETEAAMQEARTIMNGQTSVKTYRSAGDLFREIDAETDNE